MRIRLISWNIHKGIGGIDRRYRLERIIEVLREYAPDVVVLQEVAQFMPRSQFHDQAEILHEVLGMPFWAHSPQHKFRIGGYGNAILSRWPLSDVSEIDLTLAGRKKRGALQARMKVQKGKRTRTVVLYDLHLGLTGRERAAQLELFLASHPFRRLQWRTPIVLAGDLNDVWGTLGPHFLQPAGFVRAGATWNTFPAWLPMRPLDGIFVRGDVRSRGTQVCRKPLARVASDHRPLIAEFELFP